METRKLLNSNGLLAVGLPAAVSAVLLASASAVAEETSRSFEIYGFAQADYIQDFGGRLAPEWDDALRPSKIGIDGQYGGDGQSEDRDEYEGPNRPVGCPESRQQLGRTHRSAPGCDGVDRRYLEDAASLQFGDEALESERHLGHRCGKHALRETRGEKVSMPDRRSVPNC